MEKREDHDEKGPRLKPGLYTEDGEIETEDTVQRQRSAGRSARENPEESVTTLRRAWPDVMSAVDRPSGNAVVDLLRRLPW